MQKEILHNQSVFDVTLHHTGSFAKVLELAMLNGLSITDELLPGVVIAIPAVDDQSMIDFYTRMNVVPATALGLGAVVPVSDEGIGAMAIEINFIIR
jgi:hypothetical protein